LPPEFGASPISGIAPRTRQGNSKQFLRNKRPDANEAASRAIRDAAKANERAALANERAAKIIDWVSPRMFTESELKEMVRKLKPFHHGETIEIRYFPSDRKAVFFVHPVMEILLGTLCGWVVRTNEMGSESDTTEVWYDANDAKAEQAAKTLSSGLREQGHLDIGGPYGHMAVRLVPPVPSGGIVVIVGVAWGSKPLLKEIIGK
jgi:hypothetical protein